MEFKLKESQLRLLAIIWDNEPLTSMELAKLAQQKLGWKRTTTYTVLRGLVEVGLCENVNALVKSLVNRSQVEREDSKDVAEFVSKRFGGSLPRFIATFVDSNGMSKEDAEEIMDILRRNYGE